MSTFWSAFLGSLTLITASEFGDKTFFITAIMSLKHSRKAVFVSSMLAMTVMNVLSILVGVLSTSVPPIIIHWISVILFFVCGVRMILEGVNMEEETTEMVMEVEKILQEKEAKQSEWAKFCGEYSSVFVKVFPMIFFSEWGDRSQLSTIVLAANEGRAFAVGVGAFSGYFICNLIAVLGSKAIANIISVRSVTIIGGSVFILCSILKLS